MCGCACVRSSECVCARARERGGWVSERVSESACVRVSEISEFVCVFVCLCGSECGR